MTVAGAGQWPWGRFLRQIPEKHTKNTWSGQDHTQKMIKNLPRLFFAIKKNLTFARYMYQVKSIATHFRLIFTSLTLLCALALNNRELTTYTAAANVPAKEQTVQNKEQKQTEVKQKVTLEATPSYVVFQLAPFVAEGPFVFTHTASSLLPAAIYIARSGLSFFSRYCLSQIMPNAP